MTASRWIGRLNLAGLRVAELSLLAMMFIISYAVIARYLFRSPSVHAVEISAYLLVLLVWSVAGWTHIENRHVSLEAFSMSRKGWLRTLSTIVAEISTLFFCAMLLYAGLRSTLTAFEKNYRSASLLEFPLWIVLLLIPAGALMLGLVSIDRVLRAKHGAPEQDSGH